MGTEPLWVPWAFMETAKAQGNQGPKAHGPLSGGGKYTREKARTGGGSVSPLPVPYVCPSQMAPPY